MARLTVHKTVYWKEGDMEKSGKVKQIIGTHVVVASKDCEYIVNKSLVYLRKNEKKG
jgi:hypothetical protein